MAAQVERDERIDRVGVEIVQRAGEDDQPHRRCGEHAQVTQNEFSEAALVTVRQRRLACASQRLFDLERERGQDKSRDRRQEEDPTPSDGFGDNAAEHIAEENSDGQSEHENGYGLAALARRIEVANQRVARWRAARFADADPHSRKEQRPIIPSQPRCGGEETPNRHRQGEQFFPRASIGPDAEWQADGGVNPDERGPYQPHLSVGQSPFINDRFTDRRDDLPVEEVHHVYGKQNRQREPRVSVMVLIHSRLLWCVLRPYFPVKTAFRFWRKAATPSMKSAERKHSP